MDGAGGGSGFYRKVGSCRGTRNFLSRWENMGRGNDF